MRNEYPFSIVLLRGELLDTTIARILAESEEKAIEKIALLYGAERLTESEIPYKLKDYKYEWFRLHGRTIGLQAFPLSPEKKGEWIRLPSTLRGEENE